MTQAHLQQPAAWPTTPTPTIASRADGIHVDGVEVTYDGKRGPVRALSGVSLSIAPGDFLAVVGRSGSGKSTLLRVMGGLIRPSAGRVTLNGVAVEGPPRQARFVAQDYTQSLLPWLTVEDNVRFGSRHAVAARPSVQQGAGGGGGTGGAGGTGPSISELLDLVGLTHARTRYPRELSGGMQQRVAIARALASRPDILLLDEAFGSVDALSRATLQDMVLALWSALGFNAILVTHDIDEAIYLANRVVVMDEGGKGIAADVAIDLPRPRLQVETREQPRYLDYRRELLRRVLAPTQEAA